MPSATNSGRKHTYIVVLKKNDIDIGSLYKDLDTLVSRKIKNKAQACQKKGNNMRKVCQQPSYWICSIQMNELKTKSYLAEFDVQHGRFCKYSDQGTLELGAKELTSTNFEVDHLEKSYIWNKGRNCL